MKKLLIVVAVIVILGGIVVFALQIMNKGNEEVKLYTMDNFYRHYLQTAYNDNNVDKSFLKKYIEDPNYELKVLFDENEKLYITNMSLLENGNYEITGKICREYAIDIDENNPIYINGEKYTLTESEKSLGLLVPDDKSKSYYNLWGSEHGAIVEEIINDSMKEVKIIVAGDALYDEINNTSGVIVLGCSTIEELYNKFKANEYMRSFNFIIIDGIAVELFSFEYDI